MWLKKSLCAWLHSQSQPPDTPMSSVSDATKQELNTGLQMPITPQTNATHTRSKPQACKVCGKMLSSASSYYVHMKLHSGTKPFACTVSMYDQNHLPKIPAQIRKMFIRCVWYTAGHHQFWVFRFHIILFHLNFDITTGLRCCILSKALSRGSLVLNLFIAINSICFFCFWNRNLIFNVLTVF